jgi:hypothetical protein
MNRIYSYISTDPFIKWFTQHLLKHKPSAKVILLLDGHRAYCISPLLLQIAVENNVTIIHLPNHCVHTLQPLDKCFLGLLKSNLKNEAAAWMKQNPQRKITRHHMARLIG